MADCSLLVTNALLVTMDSGRGVIDRGFIAIDDDRIIGVGPQDDCDFIATGRTIDAAGKAVLPGFVNAHTHSDDLLLRGGLCDDRRLYDWLVNVVDPGCREYSQTDMRTSTELYSVEAVRSGITTVVDSVEVPFATWDESAETILGVYARAGLRVVYAQMFYDKMSAELAEFMSSVDRRPPEYRTEMGAMTDLDDALGGLELVMRRHHGSVSGRVSVWPSPGVAAFCSREAFMAAKDLAARFGVMTTVHVCESPADARQGGMTGIEYLESIGYLGPDVLAGHCVQIESSDVRLLAETGTKVATNPVSNLFLGNGIARIGELLAAGVVVGIGTDDANCNGTVNMLADLKFAALLQKGLYRDPGVITAERVLEMATIDGARAIGMEDQIGSLEVGKKADLSVMNLRAAHLVPRHSVASVVVYQANSTDIETVVVDGAVVLEAGRPTWMSVEEELDLLERAQATSERVAEAAHLPARSDQLWRRHAASAR
jgi:atrazine chlorohydrolase/5-methylthioadenosine/S-adenosylhomocysteine deaminase/melamine deaminase